MEVYIAQLQSGRQRQTMAYWFMEDYAKSWLIGSRKTTPNHHRRLPQMKLFGSWKTPKDSYLVHGRQHQTMAIWLTEDAKPWLFGSFCSRPCQTIRPLFKEWVTGKKFSYFSTQTYVVCTQKNNLNEMVLFSTQNIC